MTVLLQAGYVAGGSIEPLTHARISHSENWMLIDSTAASSTETDFDADATANTMTYEKWKPTVTPAYIEHTALVNHNCDSCCIAAHDLGTQKASISIQYHNGSTWISFVGPVTISSNNPIIALFNGTLATRWRVYIHSATAMPYIGVICFGTVTQMPRPLYGGHEPAILNRNAVYRTNRSESGELLGRSVIRRSLNASFTWSNIEADWVRTHWSSLQIGVESEPFFIAWRPDTFAVETAYVLSGPLSPPSNQGVRDLMTLELSGEAYYND